MAVWQFKFALVPIKGIERFYKGDVRFLPEYQASHGYFNFAEKEHPNYWDGCEEFLEKAKKIEEILPKSKSWSNEAKMFGDPEGNRFEIWSDGIECAVDLRNFSAHYLQGILNLAIDMGCKLVLHGSGEVVNPVWENVVEKIKASRAFSFCENPVKFFRDINSNKAFSS